MAYFEKRVTSKGVVRWRAQIRKTGQNKTFRTKARAVEWALQIEAAGERPLGKHTLLQAMRRYAQEVSPTKRGKRWEEIRLLAFERDPLSAMPIGAITSDDLGAWRDRRLKEVGPATVLREFNLLAALFEAARLEWKWVRANPVRDVRKPVAPPARRRGVKPGELEALRALAKTPAEREVIDGFELGIETGMRAGEMWSLEPEQITGSVAHLEKTKNGDSRDVALSPRAVEILKSLGGRFAVSNAVRDVLFRRMRDAAGFPGLHFHDSRSEAATRLSKKFKIQDLAAQMGWRDLNSLNFYYRPSAQDRARRLARAAPRTKKRPPRPPSAASRRSRGSG